MLKRKLRYLTFFGAILLFKKRKNLIFEIIKFIIMGM
jgi:hypothetical protein